MSILPIGTLVTNSTALALCDTFGLDYISQRIRDHPHVYRPWIFDGVSGIPDWIFNFFGDREAVTSRCALVHDLAYAYGELGDSEERKNADRIFYHNLIKIGKFNPLIAKLCYLAVRVGGHQEYGFSFTWGFADTRIKRISDRPLPWTY